MSNIPDITSLSDLITTSPHQGTPSSHAPTSDSDGGHEFQQLESEIGLDLASSKVVKKSTNEEEEEEEQTIQSQEPTVEDTSDVREVEILLQKQQQKLNLIDKREELLRSRSQLKDNVEDLRIKLKQLKALQASKLTKRKLDDYLNENDEGFDHDNSNKIHFNDDTEDNNDNNYILQNLHVLPSTNWDERLLLIKKFMPYLELDHLSTEQYYSEESLLIRVIKFTIISPLLFKFPIKLEINNHEESIKSITINKFTTALSLLSPSFNTVLMKNYIPHKKINLIIFGLNSLSILLHKRISNFYKLIRKYPTLMSTQANLQPLLTHQELNDNIKLFAILKSVNVLEFKSSNHTTIKLNWEIELNDFVTGECESKLELFIINDNNIQNKTSLLLNLIQQYGILKSIDIIIDKTKS